MAVLDRFRLIRPDGRTWTFDGVGRISVSKGQKVTDHPVEQGVAVVDHTQPLPDEITVVAFATATPLTSQSQTGGQRHLQDALDFIEASRSLLLVFSGPKVGILSDLLLTRWSYDITSEDGFPINLGLKQVRIAEAGSVVISVEAPVSTESTDPATGTTTGEDYATEHADEVDVGEQATAEVEDETEAEEDVSDLQEWVDWYSS